MPIFRLTRDLVFPSVELAEPDGLLAVGGDLSVERLLLAYRSGIFPWYEAEGPILWWAPDPRYLLFPDRLNVARSMRPLLNQRRFEVTFDAGFQDVIAACATVPRRNQPGTWITANMADAYCDLHEAGYAHSVEVYREGKLVGGLYGVCLGRAFFGESMFARESNASKFGLISLVRALEDLAFHFVDCQVYTDHLASLGAEPMPRTHFSRRLRQALEEPTIRGNWAGPLGEAIARAQQDGQKANGDLDGHTRS